MEVLQMRYLLLKLFRNKQKGFNQLELMIVMIILGIIGAFGTSSLVESRKQAQVNETLIRLRSALQSAQANANRMSTSCTVQVTKTLITATPVGCLQENITIDSDIVHISSNSTGIVLYSFQGHTPSGQTFFIRKKNGTTLDNSNANCLVVSAGLGLFRTGKTNGNPAIAPQNCINIENIRYDNEN